MVKESLRQVVYTSSAVVLPDDAMLRDILKVSSRNNERLGVTGLLLHVEGSFMQVLEGDSLVLDGLIQRIARDRRHKSMSILTDVPIKERNFAAWAMALADLSDRDVAQVPGMSDFLRQPPRRSHPGESPAMRLLETFKKTNARLLRP